MTHPRRVFMQNAEMVTGAAQVLGGCTSSPSSTRVGAAAGRIEGAQLITESSAFAKTIKEALEFAALVKQGRVPAAAERVRDAVDLHRKGRSAAEDEPIRNAEQLYQPPADQVWSIGIIGLGGGVYGVHPTNKKLRNTPATVNKARQFRTPASTYSMTFSYE